MLERAIELAPQMATVMGSLANGSLILEHDRGQCSLGDAVYTELQARSQTEQVSHMLLAIAAGARLGCDPRIRHAEILTG